MELHCRILTGHFDPTKLPQNATDADTTRFFDTHTTHQDFLAMISPPMSAEETRAAGSAIRDLRKKAFIAKGSRHATAFLRMDEQLLQGLPGCLRRVGLTAFRVDYLGGSADSEYNMLLERITLSTFQAVANGRGFDSIGIDRTRISDTMYLSTLYRNFMWGYLADQARDDARTPGSVSKAALLSQVYLRREKVSLSLGLP